MGNECWYIQNLKRNTQNLKVPVKFFLELLKSDWYDISIFITNFKMFTVLLILIGLIIELLGSIMYFRTETYFNFKNGSSNRRPSAKAPVTKRISSKEEEAIKSNGLVTIGVGLIFILLGMFL